MEFLGGEKGKAIFEVKTHLVAKNTEGARASTVAFLYTFGKNSVQEVEVLFH